MVLNGSARSALILLIVVVLGFGVVLSATLSGQRDSSSSDAPPVPKVNGSITSLEQAFEAVAENVGRGVVTVSVKRKAPSQPAQPFEFHRQLPFPFDFKDLPPEFRERLQPRGKGKSYRYRDPNGGEHFYYEFPQFDGTGSGFVFRKDGHILTNAHVVRDAEELGVRLADGTVLKAEVVGRDDIGDIAVIKVKADHELPVIALGDSDKVRVGQYALALGTPMHFKGTVSVGIISGLNRSMGAGVTRGSMIQTDAHITFGNSGGPLCNLKGEVIGMNTMITREGALSDAHSGFGFAIPINEAKEVADKLIRHGTISRGHLGLWLEELMPDQAEKLKVNRGVRVRQVIAGSPGEKAGFKKDDVIEKANGKQVVSPEKVQAEVRKHAAGDQVTLSVIRDGKPMQVTAKLGEMPAQTGPPPALEEEEEKQKEKSKPEKETVPSPESKSKKTETWRGMAVQDLDEAAREYYKLAKDEKGALVSVVESKSSASAAGVEVGDVVMELNHQRVAGAKEFERLSHSVDSKRPALLQVKRDGKTRLVTVKP